MLRIIVSFFIIFLFLNESKGQWLNYTSTNTKGLQASYVGDIESNFSGYIYFATDNGVYRYDNNLNLWTPYQNFSANVINALHVEGQTIWAATNGAGAYYSANTGNTWQQYNTGNGLSNNIIKDVTVDDYGDVWFATYGGGICKKSGTNWLIYNTTTGLPSNLYYCAYKDSDNNLWFGTSAKGLMKYDGLGWTVFNVSDGLLSNTVLKVFEDSDNRIWVCGPAGVSVLNLDNVIATFNGSNGLSGTVAYCAYQYNTTADILVGTENSVTVFSQSLQIIDTIQGLSGNAVTSIYQDGTNQYFGHESNGLTFVQNGIVQNISNWDGLGSNAVNNIFQQSNGDLWFSTNYGLTRYNGFQWNNFNTQDGFPFSNAFKGKCDSNDVIWIASYQLYRIENEQCTLVDVPVKPTNASIRSIFIDYLNRPWVVFNLSGVACLTDTGWVPYLIYPQTSGQYYSTMCVYVSENNGIWIGTSNGGVFNLINDIWTNYLNIPGYSYSSVSDITSDLQGRIWMCTSNDGLFCYDNGLWSNFTSSETGLNYPRSIFCDSEGSIWAGGNAQSGTIKAVQYKNNNWVEQIISYGTNYSYITGFFEDSDHNIWVSTYYYNGVYKAPLSIVCNPILNLENETGSFYPNPSSGSVTFETTLKESTDVEIIVYDIAGRIVDRIDYPEQTAGNMKQTIFTEKLMNGCYYFTVNENGNRWSQKMLIIKN